MTRVMLTDISPDGVRIVVDWDKFKPGASVFIPCINTAKAIEHLTRAARITRKDIEQRVRVEDGKYGVRVWRLK
jgi:hypothetical protein